MISASVCLDLDMLLPLSKLRNHTQFCAVLGEQVTSEPVCKAGLNQNLNKAFVLFELTPTNEISLLDPYEKTLGKCCTDPLRPPRFTGLSNRDNGNVLRMYRETLRPCGGRR
jgi:hypothetical protein